MLPPSLSDWQSPSSIRPKAECQIFFLARQRNVFQYAIWTLTDANLCHTDANHCHGQNIAGSWGWNIHGSSVKDLPERKSFLLGSPCLCNYSKNKLDKWCATFFSSTDSNCLVIFGRAHKQVFQRILCTKEWS